MERVSGLRAVVVLYHPDDSAIAMVEGIAAQGYAPIAVVNAIDPARLARLRAGAVDVIENDANIGLAAAFNQGIEHALVDAADYVLLLDQDTRPTPGMAQRLIAHAQAFMARGGGLACIGPVPVDRKQPEARTLARAVGTNEPEPGLQEVATIISSGMLIPTATLNAVGGMWNELFIDHIDHEWCFRARAAGYRVLVATDTAMPHDMGDQGFTLFGRYKPVHRSPVRHYHIVRNTLWLARCSVIPARWRALEVAKLGIRIPSYLLFSSARAASLRGIARALADGLAMRGGRSPTASPPIPTARSIS